MEILKKIWNFLVGSKKETMDPIEEKDEPVIVEEVKEVVQHCESHMRFRKNCLDCLRAVGAM